MRARIGEIEIDFAADKIVDHNVLAGRAEAQCALIFKNVATVLKFLQVALVNFSALALKVRTQVAADVRAFVPIESEPFQTVVNRGGSFLGVAFRVSVFDSQNEFAAVMTDKEPVEQSRARAANVQIAGRRRREANTNVSRHWSDGVVEQWSNECI